jgi:hypothetical protein
MTDFDNTTETPVEITEKIPDDISGEEIKVLTNTSRGLFIQILAFALSYGYIWMYPRIAKTGLGGYSNEPLGIAFTILIIVTAAMFYLLVILPMLNKNPLFHGLLSGSAVAGAVGLIFFVFIFIFAITTYDATGSMNLNTPNPFPFLKGVKFLLLTGGF